MNPFSPETAAETNSGINSGANSGSAPPPDGAPDRPGAVGPRPMGAVNRLGLWTLYRKELRRFLKVVSQSLLAPIVTTLLFLSVFSVAMGDIVREIGGVPFAEFLAPGLVMMAIVQSSFQNTAGSLLISKIQGNIVDVLMSPLSPGELAAAYAAAGATRGLAVGAVTLGAMAVFVPVQVQAPLTILYFAVMASVMLALLGLIGGIWSDKFEQMAAVTNFVVTPAAFLSGTFYSIERLPPPLNDFAQVNPFFFMIDGFRSGFIGRADGDTLAGGIVLLVLNLALWLVCLQLFRTGYRLKS